MSDPFLDALNARVSAPSPPPAPAIMPVADGRAAVMGVYPNAQITDNVRDPNSALGRANPSSWHNRSKAAVDVRPIDGMTYDQYVQGYKDKGYPIIEALDESGANRPSWATGANWHVVLGQPKNQPQDAPSDPNDPFLAAIDQAHPPDASVPARSTDQAGVGPGSSSPVSGVAAPVHAQGNDASGAPAATGGLSTPTQTLPERLGRALASGDGVTNAIFNGGNLVDGLRDNIGGKIRGLASVPDSMLHGAAGAIDMADSAFGLGKSHTADTLRQWGDALDGGGKAIEANPNSNASTVSEGIGAAGATLPLAEVKVLEALPAGSKLAAGLLRYGDMALQGAGAGALTSKGQDVGSRMLEGAALAPAVGGFLDTVGPKAMQIAERLKLAKSPEVAAPAAADAATEASDLPPLAPGAKIRTGAEFADDSPLAGYLNKTTGKPTTESDPDAEMVVNVVGGHEPGKPTTPSAAPVDRTIPPEAMGSRGARTGIEAHNQMPSAVADHYATLVKEGVAPDEALREADITAAGGSPTAASVSRNPEQMRAEKEGAKADTPEGQALSLQAAQNNQALHDTAQGMVASQGGAGAPGEAIEHVATSLKAASDAQRAQVAALYTKAAETSGEASVDAAPIAKVFQTVEAKAPVTAEGRAFVSGMKRQLAALTDYAPKTAPAKLPDPMKMADPWILHGPAPTKPTVQAGLTAAKLERLRQTANDAYDPTGSNKEINRLVGQTKAAIDGQFDELGKSSAAYAVARKAHRDWAQAYESPQGVSNLIRTDAAGHMTGTDSWRTAEGMIGAKNDKPFLQVVNQLKANKDIGSIRKLKASIIQDAYEHATGRNAGTAADQLGNSAFVGSKFHARLNAIGAAKLKALFSPEEYARLASLGRAGVAVNEAVPGAVNTSNTASAVINALKKGEGIGRESTAGKIANGVLHVALPVGGALFRGAEGAGIGAGIDAARGAVGAMRSAAAAKANSAKLAEALRNLSSPSATRAADTAAAKRMAEALRRRGTSRAISDNVAPAAASAQQRR